jgi:hypothetical protein
MPDVDVVPEATSDRSAPGAAVVKVAILFVPVVHPCMEVG